MSSNYTIPGVYVEEITKFPPSVAAVETAIPAFIGYTERRLDTAGNVLAANSPVRISSLTEFETRFGLAPPLTVNTVRLDSENNFLGADISTSHYLYHALQLFYANGGGDCYIVSIGANPGFGAIAIGDFTDAITALEAFDEPTIICMPDAASTGDVAYYTRLQQALLQCGTLADRVTLCDLFQNASNDAMAVVTEFRNNIGINNLKYGMAYTPWLNALLSKNVSYPSLAGAVFVVDGGPPVQLSNLTTDPDILNAIANYNFINQVRDIGTITNLLNTTNQAYLQLLGQDLDTPNSTDPLSAAITALDTAVDNVPISTTTEYDTALTNLNDAITDYEALTSASSPGDITSAGTLLSERLNEFMAFVGSTAQENAEQNLLAIFGLYKTVISGIQSTSFPVPPSGAVAGVYATVDRTRGVWKAPANVSLNNVLEPSAVFTQSQLSTLNVDTTAGKSVNAIRAFTGKGTLVWGARTLAGNDNEWRYINVRRFYNMVEESVKKACAQFVFESNDANTWVRVQAMIENFLSLQWRAGALQGASQEQAFRVAVGLGKTMNADDILNGRMIVQIAMAPVRPAEFIILRFEQKMPEA